MTHGLSSLVSTQVGKETAEKTSPKRKTSRGSKPGHKSRFYSVLVQPFSLASSRDLALSFQGGKPQDVYFHLQLELLDLDIIKALNKMIFANRAV